jgi:transcriptional regulator with GAF, ATPase, and Fis domain
MEDAMPRSAVRIKQGSELTAGKFVSLVPLEETLPIGADTMHDTLELEQLVSICLEKFANMPADRIDREITAVLHQILEACRFDRCGLMALTNGKADVSATHFTCRKGITPAQDISALKAMFPWTGENLLNGNIVCFSSLAELPLKAAVDRRHYEAMGVKSSLAIPIYVGGSVEFFIVAHLVRTRYIWRKECISLLRLIGEVFVNALYRCRNSGGGDVRLQFERLVSELSVRFINVAAEEVDREIVASLQLVREMFHFDRFGLLTFSPDKRELMVTYAAYGEGVGPTLENVDISPMFPWAKENLLRGEILHFTSLDDLPEEAAIDRQSWEALGVKANFSVPIHVAGSVEYLLVASHVRAIRTLDVELLSRLRLLGEIFANALVRCKVETARRASWDEIQRLKDKLQSEAEYLQSEIMCSQSHEEIIGQSNALARTLVLTEQVAPTQSTVLICGETGTGKELIAREIHRLSPRRNKALVKVNCASLPAALVESELFGREKGAYTGALTRQAGRFELADGGTIFLDEIAEMSLELQAKLLRVLQEGEFERLGSTRTIRVDVRVIAATNRNLAEEVKKGNFREDLYYRLNVFQIVAPPLRERIEDIPLLVWAFVNEFGEKMGKKINKVSKQDMTALQHHSWPGNVRELRNVVEHAVILSSTDKLHVQLPENGRNETPGILTLEEHEIRHIREVLRLTGWRIKGEGGAARLLGINPSTLYSRMQKLRITNRDFKDEMSP